MLDPVAARELARDQRFRNRRTASCFSTSTAARAAAVPAPPRPAGERPLPRGSPPVPLSGTQSVVTPWRAWLWAPAA